MDLTEELFCVVDCLNEASIEYALCGGFAVALHGYPRVTRDIDLLIKEESLDRTLKEVAIHGYTLAAGIIPFRVGTPQEQRVYRISKVIGEDLLTLDLMIVGEFALPIWNDRVTFDLDGRKISAVSREGLAVMKRSAGRERDLLDLKELGFSTTGDSDQ